MGLRFAVHNGKTYQEIEITEEMVGRKLGEYVAYVLILPQSFGSAPRALQAGTVLIRRALTQDPEALYIQAVQEQIIGSEACSSELDTGYPQRKGRTLLAGCAILQLRLVLGLALSPCTDIPGVPLCDISYLWDGVKHDIISIFFVAASCIQYIQGSRVQLHGR